MLLLLLLLLLENVRGRRARRTRRERRWASCLLLLLLLLLGVLRVVRVVGLEHDVGRRRECLTAAAAAGGARLVLALIADKHGPELGQRNLRLCAACALRRAPRRCASCGDR